jgi:predicted nucleic acid-binding Zn ribbon protein
MAEFGPEDDELRRLREKEDLARRIRYAQITFAPKPSLITREPNAAGWYQEGRYDGGPYDSTKYRMVKGGWDHEHCFLCGKRIEKGDRWWAALPPDTVGLCEECHQKVIDPTEL